MSPFSTLFISPVFIFFLINSFTAKAENIEITFAGINSSKGQIIVQVFKDEKGFKDEVPVKTMKFKKSQIIKGSMVVRLDLEPGIYGFALVDDENNDNKMNFNFIGMPNEGFGFSNYYHTGLNRPTFNDFKFTVSKNQLLKIQMKIRYI